MEPLSPPPPASSLPRRLAVVAAVLLVAAVGIVTPARAHGGIVPQPLVTGLPDGLPDLEARGVVAYAPRIEVTNDSPQPLTVVDDTGRPWLEISSSGVRADFSVRAWCESLASSGRGVDPDPDVEPGWTQVSTLPTWSWFDTVLLPKSADEEHDWSIPVIVDGQFDEITGVLEESDLEGRWSTDLLTDGRIGDAQLTVVSGPVPVFVVQRLDAEEVVVIGREGEPLLRLTEAGFEVNRASPSWNDHARLDPNSPVGDVVEAPDGDPVWEMQLAEAPTATWLDVRASSPDVVPRSRSATLIGAEIPIMVDGERFDVPVETSWFGDEVPLFRLTIPGLVAASLGAGLLAAGAVRLWERRREPDDGDDTRDGDGTSDRDGTPGGDDTPGDDTPGDDTGGDDTGGDDGDPDGRTSDTSDDVAGDDPSTDGPATPTGAS